MSERRSASATGYSSDSSHLSRKAANTLSNLERFSPRRRRGRSPSPNRDRRPPWSDRPRDFSPVPSQSDRSPTPPLHDQDLRHSILRETRGRASRRRSPVPADARHVRSRSGRTVGSPIRAPADTPPPAMMGDILRSLDGIREDINVLSRRSDHAG